MPLPGLFWNNWLVVLGFNATLTAKVISWRSVTHVFPGFLTCFSRGERRKYARKKSCLNRGSNSQPPGHESDTLTTEPPGRGLLWNKFNYLRNKSTAGGCQSSAVAALYLKCMAAGHV